MGKLLTTVRWGFVAELAGKRRITEELAANKDVLGRSFAGDQGPGRRLGRCR
jgi:hypothetical protein